MMRSFHWATWLSHVCSVGCRLFVQYQYFGRASNEYTYVKNGGKLCIEGNLKSLAVVDIVNRYKRKEDELISRGVSRRCMK